jgi:alanine racemase
MNDFAIYLRTLHRPVWAEIDLDNVAHNIREFQRIIPPQTQIMAVVKADAYGHGAVEVAQAALQAGANRLAIAILEEGIMLRKAGISAPIHILGISAPGTEKAVVAYDLIPTIGTIESALNFSDIGKSLGKTIAFHLKLDTGMGRIGLRLDQLPGFLSLLRYLPNLEMEGVCTHFAKADEADKTYTDKQLNLYKQGLNLLKEAGFTPRIRCLANSAAAIEVPESLFDMVRIGISLYGLYPSGEVDRTRIKLKPVMSWKAKVAHVKTLPPGEAVSYGGMFITQRPTAAATIPVGYADGYRRRLWKTGGHVLIKGQRAPIIGRVCMDMFMVDVTDIDSRSFPKLRESAQVAVGDEVVLIGTQGEETVSADEMAAKLETINYEITCLVGKRVPRVYLQGGKIQAIHSLLGDVSFNS